MLVQDELEKFAENVSYHPYTSKERITLNALQVRMSADAFRYGFAPVLVNRFAKALAEHFNEYFHPYTPLTGKEILVGNTATALNGMYILHNVMPSL